MASSKKGTSNALFASMQKVNNTPKAEDKPVAEAPAAEEPAAAPVPVVPEQQAEPKQAPAKETKPVKMVGDTEEICRQTYYYTYEEMAAIKTIGFQEDRPNSEIVRELIDFALEQKYPGMLASASVLKKADNLRDKVRKRQSIGEDD